MGRVVYVNGTPPLGGGGDAGCVCVRRRWSSSDTCVASAAVYGRMDVAMGLVIEPGLPPAGSVPATGAPCRIGVWRRQALCISENQQTTMGLRTLKKSRLINFCHTTMGSSLINDSSMGFKLEGLCIFPKSLDTPSMGTLSKNIPKSQLGPR